MPDPKISQQIETTADYHPPGTYAFSPLSFLTFYNDLTLGPDALAEQFVPISAVAQRARNTKLFAIGVIPPSANLSGNLLDRGTNPTDNSQYNTPDPSTVAPPAIPAEISPLSARTIKNLTPAAQAAAIALVEAAAASGIKLEIVNGFRSSQDQAKLFAQGRTEPGPIVTYAKPGSSLHESGMAFDVAVTNSKGKPTWPNDRALWQQIGAIGESVGLTWGGRFPELNPGQPEDLDHFQVSKQKQLDTVSAVATDVNSNNWQKDGSQNAKDSKKQEQKLAGTPLVADESGKMLLAAQRAQYLALKRVLDAMANAPPLRMIVNPKQFSVKGEKIVSDGNWGRNGPIVEHWGNNQDKISCSGQVTGFYAADVENASGPGLTRMARNYSAAWQNFQSLYLFYKNNGGVYSQDFAASDNSRNLSMLGSIYIYYDNIMYLGSFDSFNISEADTAPFAVDYSWEFTVRAAFLLDQLPDDHSYGATSPVNARTTLPTTATSLGGSSGPF
jgi:hypothetical protein